MYRPRFSRLSGIVIPATFIILLLALPVAKADADNLQLNQGDNSVRGHLGVIGRDFRVLIEGASIIVQQKVANNTYDMSNEMEVKVSQVREVKNGIALQTKNLPDGLWKGEIVTVQNGVSYIVATHYNNPTSPYWGIDMTLSITAGVNPMKLTFRISSFPFTTTANSTLVMKTEIGADNNTSYERDVQTDAQTLSQTSPIVPNTQLYFSWNNTALIGLSGNQTRTSVGVAVRNAGNTFGDDSETQKVVEFTYARSAQIFHDPVIGLKVASSTLFNSCNPGDTLCGFVNSPFVFLLAIPFAGVGVYYYMRGNSKKGK